MPNGDAKGQIFLSAPNSYDRFFILPTFWSPIFDFNVGIAINESHSYPWTSSILKVMLYVMSQLYVTAYTTNVLTTRIVIRFLSIPRVG